MNGKFIINRTRGGEYYFKLISKNGQALAASGNYETLAACKSGLKAVRNNLDACIKDCGDEDFSTGRAMYEVLGKDEKYTFLLKGSYGEVLATGGLFCSKDKCIEAIHLMSFMSIDEDSESDALGCFI
ncbi:MAG: YegP family protein [Clostridiaceae bacterium]|nr:YegP family protein [Clostridiaceae bacterium]